MQMTNKVQEYGNTVGGAEIFEGEKIPVYNKYTNELIGEVYKADQGIVNDAVSSAVNTFTKIKLPAVDRSEILLQTAKLLGENREDLVQTLVQEVGRTINDCNIEVDRAINTFTISAEEAKRISGHGVPIEGQKGNENRLSFTVRTPVGVVGAITPFNMPLNLTAHKIGPAIAAGNTVVLKPSEIAPITVLKLVKIMKEAGLPDGYLNVVNGFGSETGQYLIEDERINMFTFTGSARVGKLIKNTTGIKKVSLELGNNSPTIIHKDAVEISDIAKLAAQRGFVTANGQACIAVQRLYVHKEIYDEFLSEFIQSAKDLKVGNPADSQTDIGVMISEKEVARVEKWVREAIANGAKLECGGKREGTAYHPTVLTNVNQDMKVVCEEVFGPVVSVIPYESIDAVLQEVNHSDYGLQAGIFTANFNFAMRAVRELEFGGVIINDVSTFRTDAMPYGGIKNSGLGKEGPKYTIEEMTNEKVVVMNL
ncbi:aldehyde dehydrogenase family protein [Oceanobacillus jeddahense]|uniref:aldehyde dehydrogenase family protein n=1 Tax=Oceanobacillus jeddahense TaxID=1462527 RepID=UPI000595BF14|nr:aldehyde dehydrogenase family protein [Oceanobacillus jeddahense]